MTSRHLGGLTYRAFQGIHGWVLGTIAILLTVFFAPPDKVPIRPVALGGVIALIIIATLIQLVWTLYHERPGFLPSLITVEKSPAAAGVTAVVLLLEPSDLFAHESLVAIYRKAHSFEQLVGVGHVLTIQQDSNIQIIVTGYIEPRDGDTWKGLEKKDGDIMKQIIVKPHLPRAYAEAL
jgi:hypothetical protein